VPSGANSLLGHWLEVPVQTSATSQSPAAGRQTVPAALSGLSGHSMEVPVQSAGRSQAPCAGRHTPPALTGRGSQLPVAGLQTSSAQGLLLFGQVFTPPGVQTPAWQVSSVQGLLSRSQRVLLGLGWAAPQKPLALQRTCRHSLAGCGQLPWPWPVHCTAGPQTSFPLRVSQFCEQQSVFVLHGLVSFRHVPGGGAAIAAPGIEASTEPTREAPNTRSALRREMEPSANLLVRVSKECSRSVQSVHSSSVETCPFRSSADISPFPFSLAPAGASSPTTKPTTCIR